MPRLKPCTNCGHGSSWHSQQSQQGKRKCFWPSVNNGTCVCVDYQPSEQQSLVMKHQTEHNAQSQEIMDAWVHNKAHQLDLIETAVKDILIALGEDVNREGLLRTPARVAQFFLDFLSPPEFKFTAFENDGSSEMIVQSDIEFSSICEHHLLSFTGTAVVAYIPNGKIVGLSKLSRCVDAFARRLQNQERITRQVADALQEALDPLGVAVVLRARHSCMEMRGVKKRGAITTTSCLYGTFKTEPSCRNEFLSLANNLKV